MIIACLGCGNNNLQCASILPVLLKEGSIVVEADLGRITQRKKGRILLELFARLDVIFIIFFGPVLVGIIRCHSLA